MDTTITTFLAILKALLAGEQPAIDPEISAEQWQGLFRLAGIHKVLPLFYEAVYTHPALRAEQALSVPVKRQVTQQVITQAMRTAEFLELNRQLQAAGVRPLAVKGIICRSLYRMPDHRPSGDEDILIPAEQFDICHRVMTDFGMRTEASPQELSSAYEIPYRKPDSPLYIELHKHLFPPESDAYGDWNRFFEDAHSRCVPVQIQGHTVYTLEYTDHLFYLICHAFKHFLHSGFGIRQVCDIVLFANEYGRQIDWLRILEQCKAIHGEKFAAALFQIGKNHLVFDPDRACYPHAWQSIQVDELPMLEDLLSAGLYGDASMSRKHSSNITLDAVASRKRGRKARGALAASVFPPAVKLEGRYPYLKKHPYLVPVAWANRLWDYAKQANTRDNTASDALKIGSERVELMKLYGIIE